MEAQIELSKTAAKDLLKKDEDQLYELLGLRQLKIEEDLTVQGDFELSVTYAEHMGPMENIQKIGRRVFNKLNFQAYGLVCGTDPDDEEDRNKIVGAIGFGTEAAVIALSGILVSSFGIAAAIAGVIAAIIIKRFAEPALNEGIAAICEIWKDDLP